MFMKISYYLKLFLSFLLVFLLQHSSYSKLKSEFFEIISIPGQTEIDLTNDLGLSQNKAIHLERSEKPFSVFQFIKWKQKKNKKLIAAVLAFPFPFGMVGLHRIYLGSAPYVPIVYIGSFGGVFGILPLLDFFAILIEKDLNTYMNNNKVFMWVK